MSNSIHNKRLKIFILSPQERLLSLECIYIKCLNNYHKLAHAYSLLKNC